MQTNLVAVDADGGHLVNLTTAHRGFRFNLQRDNVLDVMVEDPDHVLVNLVAEPNGSPDAVQIDVNTGDQKTILRSPMLRPMA